MYSRPRFANFLSRRNGRSARNQPENTDELVNHSTHLLFLFEVPQTSKGRHALTFPPPHPESDQVKVMARLGEEREGAAFFVTPVPSDERMRKMPVTNLEQDKAHFTFVFKTGA